LIVSLINSLEYCSIESVMKCKVSISCNVYILDTCHKQAICIIQTSSLCRNEVCVKCLKYSSKGLFPTQNLITLYLYPSFPWRVKYTNGSSKVHTMDPCITNHRCITLRMSNSSSTTKLHLLSSWLKTRSLFSIAIHLNNYKDLSNKVNWEPNHD
jgi:hypothetical protein